MFAFEKAWHPRAPAGEAPPKRACQGLSTATPPRRGPRVRFAADEPEPMRRRSHALLVLYYYAARERKRPDITVFNLSRDSLIVDSGMAQAPN